LAGRIGPVNLEKELQYLRGLGITLMGVPYGTLGMSFTIPDVELKKVFIATGVSDKAYKKYGPPPSSPEAMEGKNADREKTKSGAAVKPELQKVVPKARRRSPDKRKRASNTAR
tara:strand:- start:1097 stop:1438 length:342 start_codon:yes stop_codon:yes gene_type:complete